MSEDQVNSEGAGGGGGADVRANTAAPSSWVPGKSLLLPQLAAGTAELNPATVAELLADSNSRGLLAELLAAGRKSLAPDEIGEREWRTSFTQAGSVQELVRRRVILGVRVDGRPGLVWEQVPVAGRLPESAPAWLEQLKAAYGETLGTGGGGGDE